MVHPSRKGGPSSWKRERFKIAPALGGRTAKEQLFQALGSGLGFDEFLNLLEQAFVG